MRIALLNTKDTPRARYLLECFREGARRFGDECLWVEGRKDMPLLSQADVGLQVCAANRHHDGDDQGLFRLEAQAAMKEAGKRLLIVDTGFVKNQYDHELAVAAGMPGYAPFSVKDPKTYAAVDSCIYYELGFDGIKGLADHCNAKSPGDRWQALGRPIKSWRSKGRNILLLGQPLYGQSTQGIDIFRWYAETLLTLRKYTKRVVTVRQHPRVIRAKGPHTINSERQRFINIIPRQLRATLTWSRNARLEADLKDAWAVVVFSSNAGVTAALEGVPVFAGNHACMAWSVANQSLKTIEKPTLPDRTHWAHKLAYGQWSAAELRSGVAWGHYRPHAIRVKS